MNERFKFRIWDVEGKRMQFPTSIPNNIGGSYDNDPIYSTYEDGVNTFYETCPPNPEIIDGIKRNGIEDYIIMQWIGLNDKNGNLIFEGDILKSDEWNPKIYQVGFNRGAFCFYNKNDDYYNDCKYLDKFEIIGNIYEHPQLLK